VTSSGCERELVLTADFDLEGTVRPLSSGFGDPTKRASEGRWLWATRTLAGPATLCAEQLSARRLRLRGFGPGGPAVLAAAPAALGLHRSPPSEATLSPGVRRLAHAARGLRLPRLPGWIEPLTLLILQQKVSGKEAARAHRELVRAVSQPAPGPRDLASGLWLPPSADTLRDLPSWVCAPLGIPPRQGETLRRVGFHAARIEALRLGPLEEAARRLRSVPGLGPWTVSSLLLAAGGGGDWVPIGDLHLPAQVAYTLAGEERADDARMLELLAPDRGHRGWLVRWIQAAGRTPPRRHPRRPLRPLAEGRGAALGALQRDFGRRSQGPRSARPAAAGPAPGRRREP